MPIEDIITQLVVVEEAIAGIKRAFDESPEKIGVDVPCFVNFPLRGRLHFSTADGKQDDHTIVCLLLYVRAHLPVSEAVVRPFIDLFQIALAGAISLGGTVSTINDIRYEYGLIEYPPGSKDDYLGIRFEVDVKEIGPITVAL